MKVGCDCRNVVIDISGSPLERDVSIEGFQMKWRRYAASDVKVTIRMDRLVTTASNQVLQCTGCDNYVYQEAIDGTILINQGCDEVNDEKTSPLYHLSSQYLPSHTLPNPSICGEVEKTFTAFLVREKSKMNEKIEQYRLALQSEFRELVDACENEKLFICSRIPSDPVVKEETRGVPKSILAVPSIQVEPKVETYSPNDGIGDLEFGLDEDDVEVEEDEEEDELDRIQKAKWKSRKHNLHSPVIQSRADRPTPDDLSRSLPIMLTKPAPAGNMLFAQVEEEEEDYDTFIPPHTYVQRHMRDNFTLKTPYDKYTS